MSKFNVSKSKIGFDFVKGSMKLLTMVGQEPVVSYASEFKGRGYFSIRRLWNDENADNWMPGKGVTVPAAQAAEFCKAVGGLTIPKVVGANAKGKARKAA